MKPNLEEIASLIANGEHSRALRALQPVSLESFSARAPDSASLSQLVVFSAQCLTQLNRSEEALAIISQSVETGIAGPEILVAGGEALLRLGAVEQAESAFRQVLALNNRNPDGYLGLAEVFLRKDEQNESLIQFKRALAINPNHPLAWANMGSLLLELGRLPEALEAFQKATSLEPERPGIWLNLGGVLHQRYKLEQAEEAFRKAIALLPDFPAAWNNMGHVLCDQGKIQEALVAYDKALKLTPPSDHYDIAHSNRLVTLHYDDTATPEAVWEEHRCWQQALLSARPELEHPAVSHSDETVHLAAEAPASRARPSSTGNQRLRIGYLSPDFRLHSVAYFLYPLLSQHDRTRFEVFCYAEVPRPDEITRKFTELADHWRYTHRMSDDELVSCIRTDQLDVLVELAGHYEGNRLKALAYKPAPVQVTWLGYPDTTGLDAMDWRFSDDVADPAGSEHYASEKIIRLKGGFHCYDPLFATPEIGPTPALETRNIAFGSFNNFCKISDTCLKHWSAILNALPESHLVVKCKQMADKATRERLKNRLVSLDIDPSHLRLLPRSPTRSEHLEAYNAIDIALDTFPYNGTTTTCEALWMGVPVLTIPGKTHASRVSASLLTHLGHPEWIATNRDELVSIAQGLTQDIAQLNRIRCGLRQMFKDSPLHQAESFARKIETQYLNLCFNQKG